MPFPYYARQVKAPPADVPEDLTLPRHAAQRDPQNYLPDQGLVDAVNVALLLGQPLLLTGEPGTGKTQLAYSVSWQLGFKEPSPLIFETKSTSTARDLFYTYDTVGRFHAAQTRQGSQDSRAYITYGALGKAILLANEEKEVERFFPAVREDASDGHRALFKHGGRRRSVVLIDEIDKAPRDFPNDILNEVENMYFKITELENAEVRAEERWRPVLILTSNSEKGLPDAFLRRCIYYNIPFPEDKADLKRIVAVRLGYATGAVDDALELFYRLRAPNSLLVKKPATAELLSWLTAIRALCQQHGFQEGESGLLKRHPKELIDKTLSVLVKNEADQGPAKAIVQEWLSKK